MTSPSERGSPPESTPEQLAQRFHETHEHIYAEGYRALFNLFERMAARLNAKDSK